MTIETQKTKEIQTRLGKPDTALDLHREALQRGMPLSAYMEVLDPTPDGVELDAFQRQLKANGIITRSDPAAGWWASEAKVFFDTPQGRALYPEFFAREWRKVSFRASGQRAAAIVLSSDAVLGTYERPYNDAASPAWNNQFAPAIPLNELVAATSPISGEDFRSLYMTYDEDALRLFRIGESAEIPMATLTTSPRSIRLRKYGRGLRTTYEALRRMRVDRLAWWVRWQAMQAEIDLVEAALHYMINGDGNNGTAATNYNLLTLDTTANSGELTLLGWLKFRMQFTQPYTLTTALMQIDEAIQVIMLNAGTANLPLVGLNLNGIGNSLTPINTTGDGVRYGWLAEAPDQKILGFDRRFALERVTEIGSEIRETERFITNQTEVMVMTENSGFAVIDPAATKILTLNA